MVNKTDTLLACIAELADRHVVGSDPFDRERLAFNIQRAEYGRPGEVKRVTEAEVIYVAVDAKGEKTQISAKKS